jgi:hypothetical protein
VSNELRIDLADGRTSFAPGELLQATAEWKLECPVEAVELRLCWITHGEGQQGTVTVAAIRIETPELSGNRSWATRLPNGPYSFIGDLISLAWSLELVVEPTTDTYRLEIILAPRGKAIQLYPEMVYER